MNRKTLIGSERYNMKITPFFRWYDLWIGAYIDREKRTVYVCPIPMFGFKIEVKRRLIHPTETALSESKREQPIAPVFASS